jgi:glycosyl hydrolase family 123
VDWNTSVRDWWLVQMSQLADLGVDGIYCDDPYTHPSYNHRTGTAFIGPDGKVRPNYGLYGLCDYLRRLRTVLDRKANHPHMLLHMSNQLTLPFQIYFDSIANGEHMNRRLKQHYIGKLTTAEIRAQYMGYQWGNIPIILPEIGEKHRKTPEPTEEMLALMLPHDVLIWVAWCHTKTTKAHNAALQEDFRTWADDCTFLPYWESRGIVDGQDAQLVVSTYVRKDKLLLIVANWSDQARQARLTLNWRKLTAGAAMTQATVMLNRGTAQLSGNTLGVDVPARNLRLVVLEK